MAIIDRKVLPLPDLWGNYWMTKSTAGPAIFRSRRKGAEGLYFASTGQTGYTLMDKAGLIRYWKDPEEAYKALKEIKAI